MKLPTYQFLAQMGAAFAVVVSLGFVAFELKQARDVATAELSLAVIAMEAEDHRSILDAKSYNSYVYKTEVSGEELTHMEKKNRDRVFRGEVTQTKAKYVLWESGLLADGEWEYQRLAMLNWFSDRPHTRPKPSLVDDDAYFGRKSFDRVVRSLWAQWKAENPIVYKEWLAEEAAAAAELEAKVNAENYVIEQ